MLEKIEILPVTLLDEHRLIVNELKVLAKDLRLEFGWHYLLDLAWIIAHLGPVNGKRILDAGAGTGMLQWYLAEHGASVLSVDRASRAKLLLRFRQRYQARGLRRPDLLPYWQVVKSFLEPSIEPAARLKAQARELMDLASMRRAAGRVVIYNQDLKSLVDLSNDSVDAVVAVSALEHNPPGELPTVVAELLRVLKPGGPLLATLGAARGEDWFHPPSQGWNYSAASLRRIFELPASTPDNYDRYDELFEELRNCRELSDSLASFYSKSGDNGMPWGKWDPLYQSVGVLKIKTASA